MLDQTEKKGKAMCKIKMFWLEANLYDSYLHVEYITPTPPTHDKRNEFNLSKNIIAGLWQMIVECIYLYQMHSILV